MTDAPYIGIGKRLEAVRAAFGNGADKSTWAARHGWSQSQYSNWVAGTRRILVEDAERLCDLYGLSLDFIYRGRRDGLSEKASKVL